MSLEDEDPRPFDAVSLSPVMDDLGVGWRIVGERDGGERSVRVPYRQFLAQAEGHLIHSHAKGASDGVSDKEWNHALIRAAVTFLID